MSKSGSQSNLAMLPGLVQVCFGSRLAEFLLVMHKAKIINRPIGARCRTGLG